jgi:hypothetical protein
LRFSNPFFHQTLAENRAGATLTNHEKGNTNCILDEKKAKSTNTMKIRKAIDGIMKIEEEEEEAH